MATNSNLIDQPEDEQFSAYLRRVREEVRNWPEWMRGVLGRYVEADQIPREPKQEPQPPASPKLPE
jgi:hypothetical protein